MRASLRMNFAQVISAVCGKLDQAGVRYAVIGGFSMALRGVQRATMDLDVLLMLEDLEIADRILTGCGYRREFHSENVSHYMAGDSAWGRIDILHAFRGPSLGMLRRAERLPAGDDMTLPVATIEDIAGLKIQALVNDPARRVSDWNDIRLLVESARAQSLRLDWELLADYLRLFQLEDKLTELKSFYGPAQ